MHASDGNEHSVAAARDAIADKFELTEAEREERLPSGSTKTFHNRVAWAKTYLERACLLTMVRRGVFKISARGKELIQESPARIDIDFLKRYPEFAAFRKQSSDAESKSDASNSPTTATPEDRLKDAHAELQDALANDLLLHIREAHPSFFESLVVDLMLRMGYGGPRDESGFVTSYGSDEGIDGIIYEDALGLDVVYLQAKRWENTVGRPEIQKFVGALHGKRARKGVFLTTSSFSSEALEYVKTIDPRVVLVDGTRLAHLMIENDVGVSTAKNFAVKKVDSDYFEGE